MFGDTKRQVRVKKFDLQHPSDVADLEYVKGEVYVKNTDGWAILTQKELSTKDGDIFVYLEWIEPVGR